MFVWDLILYSVYMYSLYYDINYFPAPRLAAGMYPQKTEELTIGSAHEYFFIYAKISGIIAIN